jgi:hypothetical protein
VVGEDASREEETLVDMPLPTEGVRS